MQRCPLQYRLSSYAWPWYTLCMPLTPPSQLAIAPRSLQMPETHLARQPMELLHLLGPTSYQM